ncbi:MAG: 16S rRNA (guanine(966)-N(2))-methyltransferase RsmD [Clostridia bacterium]|nr:16S rRNA (guanine(966)-N(2))-methyltransferase RsmD [Clostridia bacterium]
MRIITGSARGTNLLTPEGTDTRPTPSKVKEALFSSIQFDIEGRTVLDLFAGSGGLGLEALSRGAVRATFVDSSAEAVSVITKNAQKTHLYEKSNIIRSDYVSYLRSSTGGFGLIFLDPPYASDFLREALNIIAERKLAIINSIVVCETEKDIESVPDYFKIIKKLSYGRIKITLLTHTEE